MKKTLAPLGPTPTALGKLNLAVVPRPSAIQHPPPTEITVLVLTVMRPHTAGGRAVQDNNWGGGGNNSGSDDGLTQDELDRKYGRKIYDEDMGK